MTSSRRDDDGPCECELARTGLGGTAVGLVLVDWVLDGLEYDCPRRDAPGDSRDAGVTDVAVDIDHVGPVSRSRVRQRGTRPLIFKIATTTASPARILRR